MRDFFIRCGVFVISLAAILFGVKLIILSGIRSYPYAVAEDNSFEKQSGQYFIENMPDNHVLILGSSELNVKMIASHPSNLLKSERGGFVPNIVGRGSCQAIVHAAILASAGKLRDRSVVVILSPQSYTPEGIKPDMYFANFSELQFCKILLSGELSASIKEGFKLRMARMAERYDGEADAYYQYYWISKSKFAETISLPYIYLKKEALTLKDISLSFTAYKNAPKDERDATPIDWSGERLRMARLGPAESDNNRFGFLNDYYNVNVGRKLAAFEGCDSDLSYADSDEYDDLALLLDVCKEKGIRPLVISVPLHGAWSDYTGFAKEARRVYYDRVNDLICRYDAELCDLSEFEYEPYFLCDVMHLGWIGWLETNERISRFYNIHQR